MSLHTLTFSGAEIDLESPHPATIRFGDIATHLSKLARWAGATQDVCGYSVAQHSAILAETMARAHGPRPAMYALLHDAHEAYTGDIIEPVRAEFERMLGEPFRAALSGLRARLDRQIHARLRLAWPVPDEIADAIDVAHWKLVATESRDLLMNRLKTDAVPFALRIKAMPAAQAHENFLNTLRTLAAHGGIPLGDDWL